jgi:hypothetical protein
MRYAVIGCCFAIASVSAVPAQAQVHVDIGINLPGPPQWAGIPGLPVYYAPAAPANVFRYGGQYYAFANGGWYAGPGYNGPWIVVAPPYVPAPLLRVPVRYYHEPPGHWREWRHEEPPRWEHEYGHDWDRQRAGWRDDRDHGERDRGERDRHEDHHR